MSDSDSGSESDIPSKEVCEQRCQEFAAVTGTDSALAMFFLQNREWDLEKAINSYFESNSGSVPGKTAGENNNKGSGSGEGAVDKISRKEGGMPKASGSTSDDIDTDDPEPHRIRLLTWNIDGLDSNNLVSRTKGVCAVIQKEMPHVILLQEVVPQSLVILENECPQFQILAAGKEDYFTVIMMHIAAVVYESHEIIPFYSSVMMRNMLRIKGLVKGIKCQIITSHLESTKAHASERKTQLRTCLKVLTEGPDDTNMLLAGDLNLRDAEIRDIGGLPENVLDMWEVTGKRPEARYTWDTTRNDNLGMDPQRRAKCRFDRVYMRHSTPPQLRAVHFELVGLERLKSCQRFPSDHWGVMTHYDKITKSAKTQ